MTVSGRLIADVSSIAAGAGAAANPAPAYRQMADALRRVVTGPSGAIPAGMADVATVLWTRYVKYDAADPDWADRDRFLSSAGQSATLLQGIIHLIRGSGAGAEFASALRLDGARQDLASAPPGHAVSIAVGMALAERIMAARFGKSLVDHRTWVIAGEDDLVEGVTLEAAAVAGQLRLEKLTVLLVDTASRLSAANHLRGFSMLGWAVKTVDGHEPREVASALSFAVRARKPTLITCRIRDGGTDNGDEVGPFGLSLPDEALERWRDAGSRSAGVRRAWLKRAAHHPMRTEFDRVMSAKLPDSWQDAVAAARAEVVAGGFPSAMGLSQNPSLEIFAAAVPELVGGTAGRPAVDVDPLPALGMIGAANYTGRHIPFGTRVHAMAGCLNGLAMHGGTIPFGGAGLTAADAMRPSIRLAATMGQRIVFLLTEDPVLATDAGSSLSSDEHLASLRAIPNLHVFRPADPLEALECWELAIRRGDGPSVIVLAGEGDILPQPRGENRCARGGYVLAEADGPRQATIVATGPEVATALAARQMLAADGIPVAVLSLPCWALFEAQDEAYRAQVLGGVARIGVEAACGFGWERWLGESGLFIGLPNAAPRMQRDDPPQSGILPEAVVSAVRKRLN